MNTHWCSSSDFLLLFLLSRSDLFSDLGLLQPAVREMCFCELVRGVETVYLGFVKKNLQQVTHSSTFECFLCAVHASSFRLWWLWVGVCMCVGVKYTFRPPLYFGAVDCGRPRGRAAVRTVTTAVLSWLVSSLLCWWSSRHADSSSSEPSTVVCLWLVSYFSAFPSLAVLHSARYVLA